jgi:hypothetical protein
MGAGSREITSSVAGGISIGRPNPSSTNKIVGESLCMDRTSEFTRIVQSTNIPQAQLQQDASPYTQIFQKDGAISKALAELQRTLERDRIYESFTIQGRMDKIREMISEMREASCIERKSANEQELASYANLGAIIRNRMARHLLKLNELTRKREGRSKVVEERRQRYDSGAAQAQEAAVMMEDESAVERTRERRKIAMQISEIGQIMEEISVHVSLQEESLKRIDESMEASSSLVSGSLELCRKTWENVSGTRGAILKFLMFWVVLALVFWVLRR